MKNMKKLAGAALIAVLALTGCAGNGSTESTAAPTQGETQEVSQAESQAETTAAFTGDGYDETVDYAALNGATVTVAASPKPHAEILNVAADILKEAGITLKVVEYDDYVQPNLVVDHGELDANFFQHVPYLDDFNAENGTKLVSVAGIHVEPMGVYGGKSTSLADIKDGAQIAVPNDTTNEARALLLLEKQGLIKLKENAGITATKNDIAENPHNIDIVEAEAAQLPRVLKDVDFAVINSNYAIEADLNPVKDALAIEDSSSEYVNVLVVKEGNENEPIIKALVAALESDKVREFINTEYNGSCVPVF